MLELVPFDLNVHMEDFRQLDTEYYMWQVEYYPFDAFKKIGRTIEDVVEGDLEVLKGLEPPEGIFYLLNVDGVFAGMGGLRKLDEGVARVMWMYIRPENRGRGYGRQMLNKLLEDGRKFGYSTFQLRPPKFGTAAINLYRSAGFTEIDDSESMLPPLADIWKPYWFDMEKKE